MMSRSKEGLKYCTYEESGSPYITRASEAGTMSMETTMVPVCLERANTMELTVGPSVYKAL